MFGFEGSRLDKINMLWCGTIGFAQGVLLLVMSRVSKTKSHVALKK